MKTRVKILISKFGQNITVTRTTGETPIQTKAFIQPLRCDEQSELYGDYTDSEKNEQYLYIGFPEINLSDTTSAIITFEGKNYTIKKAEKVNVLGEDIYERAVIEEVKS